MRILLAIAVLSGLLASCNQKLSKEEQQAILKEMKDREIKRVSDADIFAGAMAIGDSLSAIAQQTLGSRLKSTIQTDGVVAAIEYCNVNAYPLIDSLSEQYSAVISRKSLRIRNPADTPDDVEKQILEAYDYNLEEGISLSPNIQKVSGDTVLYTKPILLNNAMCLMCHGQENEISPEVLKILEERYPDDDAKGHQMNDLRGIWSIRLPVKVIVNDL